MRPAAGSSRTTAILAALGRRLLGSMAGNAAAGGGGQPLLRLEVPVGVRSASAAEVKRVLPFSYEVSGQRHRTFDSRGLLVRFQASGPTAATPPPRPAVHSEGKHAQHTCRHLAPYPLVPCRSMHDRVNCAHPPLCSHGPVHACDLRLTAQQPRGDDDDGGDCGPGRASTSGRQGAEATSAAAASSPAGARAGRDSYLEITYPFSSNPTLRDQYRRFLTDKLRLGLLLEDLDTTAGEQSQRAGWVTCRGCRSRRRFHSWTGAMDKRNCIRVHVLPGRFGTRWGVAHAARLRR